MNTKRKKPFTIFLQYNKASISTIIICSLCIIVMLMALDEPLSVALTSLLLADSIAGFLFIGLPYADNRHQIMKLKDIPITQEELQEHNVITPSEWWGYVLYDMYKREKLSDMISSYINDCFRDAFPHNHITYENLYMIRNMFYDKNQFITYLNNIFTDIQNSNTDSLEWHFVSDDGFPEPNEHGYWCKLSDGSYERLYYDNGFYHRDGSCRVYIENDNDVIAWQPLTEI